jgi:ABC-type branched-subunit amino acid transport system substrate-binding protein
MQPDRPIPLSRRRWLGLWRGLPAAAIGVPFLSARAAEAPVSGTEIVVGQNISLQGGRNVYAAEAQAGILAWLDPLNRSGGVNGRRVVLRTLDDDADSARAEANARKLVADGAFVLFGSIEGGPSTAVMKAAVELGVPFIGPMAGPPGFRRPHQPLVFPVRAEHREEFRALITQGHRLGLKKVALFHADSAVGLEHLANVQKLAAEIGIGFGGGVPFKGNIDDAQLRAVAAGFADRQVDLVINHGSSGVYGRLIRQARSANLRTAYWGVNSGSSQLAQSLGELAHGMVFSQVVPNPHSGKTALAREFRARHEQAQPGKALSYGGLEGFMTAKALTLALRAAGAAPTRASLLVGLKDLRADLGGLSLRWREDEHTGTAFVDLALVGRDGRFIQ